MSAFLRFSPTVSRDAAIDAWLDARPAELAMLARTWFARLRECGDDVRELMHDGCPTACVHDAAFAYVGVYTTHVNLGFFHGAALADPDALLDGNGKYMRHVKLRPGGAVREAALQALVLAAYRDIRARLAAEAPPRR